MKMTQRLLNLLWSPAIRKRFRNRGRKLTGGPNACAATASQYYIALGVLAKPEVNTQRLLEKLEATGKFERVELAALQSGDLIFTIDANGNDWPDHVWHLYGFNWPAKTADGDLPAGWGWAVDNYSAQPYPRNIYKGPKTPAHFALRLR